MAEQSILWSPVISNTTIWTSFKKKSQSLSRDVDPDIPPSERSKAPWLQLPSWRQPAKITTLEANPNPLGREDEQNSSLFSSRVIFKDVPLSRSFSCRERLVSGSDEAGRWCRLLQGILVTAKIWSSRSSFKSSSFHLYVFAHLFALPGLGSRLSSSGG